MTQKEREAYERGFCEARQQAANEVIKLGNTAVLLEQFGWARQAKETADIILSLRPAQREDSKERKV